MKDNKSQNIDKKTSSLDDLIKSAKSRKTNSSNSSSSPPKPPIKIRVK